MRAVSTLLLASVATAFFAPPTAVTPTLPQLRASPMLDGLEGQTKPFGLWDPLGLADLGTETTVAWYRAAEIKHGRVAMAATVGWIINEMGLTFPGEVATGVTYKSLGKGVDAWVALPDYGKAQIIAFIGILELGAEAQQPHYLKGGRIGYVPGPLGYGKLWNVLDTQPKDEAKLETLRNKELNNGRLAMIAAIGFFSASYLPGSVPGLPASW